MTSPSGMTPPGRYRVLDSWRELPAVYIDIHGVAACGGPYLDVTFDVFGRRARRTVRVAVDGSWRCASTFLPINAFGDTFT